MVFCQKYFFSSLETFYRILDLYGKASSITIGRGFLADADASSL